MRVPALALSYPVLLCLAYGMFFAVCPVGPLGTAVLLQSSDGWREVLFVRLAFLLCAAATVLALSRLPGARGAAWRSCMMAGCLGLILLYAGGLTGFGAAGLFAYAVLSGMHAGGFMHEWSQLLYRVYVGRGRASSITVFGLAIVCSTVLSTTEVLVSAFAIVSLILMLVLAVLSWMCLEGAVASGGEEGTFGRTPTVSHMPVWGQAVMLSLGFTWALEFNLSVDLGFAGQREYLWTLLSSLAAYAICQTGIVVLVRKTRLGTARFGLMLRWVIVFVGTGWVTMPLLVGHAPGIACAMCVMMFLVQCVIAVQFLFEVCYERRVPFREVGARCAGMFMLAACIGSLAFLMFKEYADSWTLQCLIAAAAVVASLLVVPLLPSRGAGAGVFMLEKLPEDESVSARVESAKRELVSECALTAREAEVLDLVVVGLSRDEIAEELGLSAWTVKNHCRSIYEKTGVHSARELIARVYGDGCAR